MTIGKEKCAVRACPVSACAARGVRGCRDRGTVCACVRGGNSSCTKYMRYVLWIVYNHRVRVCEPSATPPCASRGPSIDAYRPSNGPSLHLPFGLPLQTAAAEYVGHNDIQQPSYRMGFPRVKRQIYRVKPTTGGEGVRPGYTTATTTHKTPQIFFRQLARMRACPSRLP